MLYILFMFDIHVYIYIVKYLKTHDNESWFLKSNYSLLHWERFFGGQRQHVTKTAFALHCV